MAPSSLHRVLALVALIGLATPLHAQERAAQLTITTLGTM